MLWLYSIVTSVSLPARIPLSKFSGFLGMTKEEGSADLISWRSYFTNLWASVAAKISASSVKLKKTPFIIGRKSSFPVAKKVLCIAVAKICPLRVI